MVLELTTEGERLKKLKKKLVYCGIVRSSGHHCMSGPEVIKPFSYSTQLRTKFILLINVNILTFISMIYTTSERLKAKNFFICRYLAFISS